MKIKLRLLNPVKNFDKRLHFNPFEINVDSLDPLFYPDYPF